LLSSNLHWQNSIEYGGKVIIEKFNDIRRIASNFNSIGYFLIPFYLP